MIVAGGHGKRQMANAAGAFFSVVKKSLCNDVLATRRLGTNWSFAGYLH